MGVVKSRPGDQMDGLAQKVVVELQEIFPNRTRDALLKAASDPSLYYGIVTEELLLQRCIEHLLDGAEGEMQVPPPHTSSTLPLQEKQGVMSVDHTKGPSLSSTPKPHQLLKTTAKLKDLCYGPYFHNVSPVSTSRSPSPAGTSKDLHDGGRKPQSHASKNTETESSSDLTSTFPEDPGDQPVGKKGKSGKSASNSACGKIESSGNVPNFILINDSLDTSSVKHDVDKVLAFFPDADPTWVEERLADVKQYEPNAYLDIVVNSMFDTFGGPCDLNQLHAQASAEEGFALAEKPAVYQTFPRGDSTQKTSTADHTSACEGLLKSPNCDVWLNKQSQIEKQLSDSLIILDSTPQPQNSAKSALGDATKTSDHKEQRQASKRKTDVEMCDEASPVKQKRQQELVESFTWVTDDDNDNSLDLLGLSPSRDLAALASGASPSDAGHACTESGGTSVPTLPDELIFWDDEELNVTQLPCDKCDKPQQTMELAQCSDGHILCRACVERVAKLVLSSGDQAELGCPVNDCTHPVPLGEAERVLHSLVMELLREKSERESLKKIAAMEGIVQCPSCECVVEMMPGDREFRCCNAGCMLTCCRYCKEDWNGRDHSSCSPLLSTVGASAGSKPGALPANWAPFPENFTEDFMKVELDMNSEEGQQVCQLFYETMPQARVCAVYRIQNVRLWQKFALIRQHMTEDFGPQKLNERLMFHGTHTQVFDNICKEGFDWRVCGVNGTMYGQGCYFAADASYSGRYSLSTRGQAVPAKWLPSSWTGQSQSPDGAASQTAGAQASGQTLVNPIVTWAHAMYMHSAGRGSSVDRKTLNKMRAVQHTKGQTLRLMFVARVLCGRTVMGNTQMRRPPPDPSDPKQRPYSSTCDNPNKPTIIVVYDSAQAYPEYVVAYT